MQQPHVDPAQGGLAVGDYRVSGVIDGQLVSAARVGEVWSCSPALEQRVGLLVRMGEVLHYPDSQVRFTATTTGPTLHVVLTLLRAIDRPLEVRLEPADAGPPG